MHHAHGIELRKIARLSSFVRATIHHTAVLKHAGVEDYLHELLQQRLMEGSRTRRVEARVGAPAAGVLEREQRSE